MNTVYELHKSAGGTVHPAMAGADWAKKARLGRVVTDSREVEQGDLFWALVGPNHDGSEFAGEAFERGAAGVVAGRTVNVPPGRWALVVEDSLPALHQWAKTRRSRFTGTVIAVTGSVGKTTQHCGTPATTRRPIITRTTESALAISPLISARWPKE